MNETVDLGMMYRESRQRLSDLVRQTPDPARITVPGCPAWTVHDVVAHLVAVVEDVQAGRLTRPPSDEETANQVARRAGRDTSELLEEWASIAGPFEDLLTRVAVWPPALDVLSHEFDVRGAMGLTDAHDIAAVQIAGHRMIAVMDLPVGVRVHLDGSTYHDGDLELTTTPFEAFRFRFGRRSKRQIASMEWNGDPAPVLDHLTVFGPSRLDIVE